MVRSAVAFFFLLAAARAQHPGARTPSAAELAAMEASAQAAVESNPSAATWEKLGLIRHLQNRFEEAITAFQAAIRLQPGLWTSQLFLGICQYRTNRFQEALTSLQTAARAAPGDPRSLDEIDYWLAADYVALKRPVKALQLLERLLQRNPKHAEGLELAVRTYMAAGESLWNQVAERDFDSAAGQEVHGHALESEGNRGAALEAFRQSRTLGPKRAGPGLSAGRLLLIAGKAEEALRELESEAMIPGASPEVAYYAGLAAVQSGRGKEAAAWLEEAALWPDRNPDALLALAQVYAGLKETASALTAARKAAGQNPSSAQAHELLIAFLEQSGLEEEAKAERLRWQAVQAR